MRRRRQPAEAAAAAKGSKQGFRSHNVVETTPSNALRRSHRRLHRRPSQRQAGRQPGAGAAAAAAAVEQRPSRRARVDEADWKDDQGLSGRGKRRWRWSTGALILKIRIDKPSAARAMDNGGLLGSENDGPQQRPWSVAMVSLPVAVHDAGAGGALVTQRVVLAGATPVLDRHETGGQGCYREISSQ